MKQIFWLDKWEGKARSGYYVRNPLCEFFKRCKQNGLKIVGLVIDDSYNLEAICEKTEEAKEAKKV